MNQWPVAYRCDDPAVLAAYRQAVDDAQSASDRLRQAALDLGAGGAGVLNNITTARTVAGLYPKSVDSPPPAGWRLHQASRTGRYREPVWLPRRGRPGEPARAWLAAHQLVDIRFVMAGHGLPRHCWVPAEWGPGAYDLFTPCLFEHDGALWACYPVEPGTAGSLDGQRCTWPRVPLSQFHAAREANEASEPVPDVAG